MDGIREKKNIENSNPDTEKLAWHVLTFKWILDIKQRITSQLSTTPKNLGNKENPKRDIHRYPWEGEIDKIS